MQQTENYRLFVADDSFDVQDFFNWRKNVETESHKLNEDCIEKKLKDYPLEKRTPLEAFLFLQKLQENILEKNALLIISARERKDRSKFVGNTATDKKQDERAAVR